MHLPPRYEEQYREQVLEWLGRINLDFGMPDANGKTKVSISEFGITIEGEDMDIAYAMAMGALDVYIKHLTTELALGHPLPPRPKSRFRLLSPSVNE